MSDTKSPIHESASLAALKTAIMAEQRMLQFDARTARLRTEALLDAPLYDSLPASAPLYDISMERELL